MMFEKDRFSGVIHIVYLWIFTMIPWNDFDSRFHCGDWNHVGACWIVVLIKETWVTTHTHHSHPPAVWIVKLCFSFFNSSHLLEYTLTPMIQTYFLNLTLKDLDLLDHNTSLCSCLEWKCLPSLSFSCTGLTLDHFILSSLHITICIEAGYFHHKMSLTSFISEFVHSLKICIDMHGLFMRLTALPSFCCSASLSFFLPVCICCIWLPPPHLSSLCLLLPHLCLPGFLSDPLLIMKWSLKERAAFDGDKSPDERDSDTFVSVYLSLCLLVTVCRRSSLCFLRQSMWLWEKTSTIKLLLILVFLSFPL